jgi:hypothetical protein
MLGTIANVKNYKSLSINSGMLTMSTYSYVLGIITCNGVLIMMHTVVYLLISYIVIR